MKLSLSIIWYIASILIIYSGIKYTLKYKFMQFNIKKIFEAIKSKSKNNISPFASLCLSLAAKIGVGSISGMALAIYFGGVGTIFWICLISLIIAINTYVECDLGIKYRIKNNDNYYGGPSYYIEKGLNNKWLSYLYSVLIIITYSMLFLAIQVNTIIGTTDYFSVNKILVILIILLISGVIIFKGLNGISKFNAIIVPLMLIFYFGLGIYIFINNIEVIPNIFLKVIKEALNIKSIVPCLLIGMQRAIFITESSLGTSAISACTCDNDSHKQGMLEVFGIYITVFIVCLTTFIIIVTSNYQEIKLVNGIDVVLYAFNYHFGGVGTIFLAIIIILFAFSTIISSYYFGESNLYFLTKSTKVRTLLKFIFLLIIAGSIYFKGLILWHITDYFVAFLAIINTYAITRMFTHKL